MDFFLEVQCPTGAEAVPDEAGAPLDGFWICLKTWVAVSFDEVIKCGVRSMQSDKPGCDNDEHAQVRSLSGVEDDTLEKAASIFRALADPSRLRLLVILSEGEACVTELSDQDQLSTVSQRLRTLRSENLVSRKRSGKHIIYGLADDHVLDMIRNALVHAGEDY